MAGLANQNCMSEPVELANNRPATLTEEFPMSNLEAVLKSVARRDHARLAKTADTSRNPILNWEVVKISRKSEFTTIFTTFSSPKLGI